MPTLKNSLILMGIFAAGSVVGWALFSQAGLPVRGLDVVALYLLLFFVGLVVGGDSKSWALVRRAHWRLALVPVGVALGTLLAAGLLAAAWHGLPLGRALACGAGFGYYSLSSVLLTELTGQEDIGVLALLANIMRELMTLLLAPVLVRLFGRLSLVAAGGATAMDTTLPIITRCSGQRYAVVAVFSGFVLTALVPLLLPLLLHFFPVSG